MLKKSPRSCDIVYNPNDHYWLLSPSVRPSVSFKSKWAQWAPRNTCWRRRKRSRRPMRIINRPRELNLTEFFVCLFIISVFFPIKSSILFLQIKNIIKKQEEEKEEEKRYLILHPSNVNQVNFCPIIRCRLKHSKWIYCSHFKAILAMNIWNITNM